MADEKDKKEPVIVIPSADTVAQYTTPPDLKQEFIELLIRLDPQAETLIHKAFRSLPEVAHTVAITCFIEEKQCPDVDALRRQLKHLQEHGVFDFKPRPLTFMVIELEGMNLYKLPPEVELPLTHAGQLDDLTKSDRLITTEDGLKAGDRVLFQSLMGWVAANVLVDEVGSPYGDTETTRYVFNFVHDRPSAPPRWVSQCAVNKLGVKRFKKSDE